MPSYRRKHDLSKETTVIRAKESITNSNYRELLNYKDLIFLFVRRNFVVQYKQTVLGPIWLFLGPLITTITYTVVFGLLVGVKSEGVPPFLFFMAGVILWTFFSTNMMNNANTFVAHSGMLSKVYFPRLTIPISQMITCVINFLIQFGVFLLFLLGNSLFLGGPLFLSWRSLLVVPIVLQVTFLGLGTGLIITSLTTRYRDLAVAVSFCLQLLMYASPVIYPLSQAGNGLGRILLLCNPLTAPINNFRYALFGQEEFLGAAWAASALATVLLLFAGLFLYSKAERTFLDTI